MAQSMATKTKAITFVGTSLENTVAVIKLPDPKKVLSLMTMVNSIIEKHGRLAATAIITSRNWLYLDADTIADDDNPMVVPGYGVAVADDDPRINADNAGRIITVDKEMIERYTKVIVNGKTTWQQRGENAHLKTAQVETEADAARLAKQKAKKAEAGKATKSAGAAKKPAAPKAKGTKTSKKSTAPKAAKSAGAPKQKTVKKDGVYYTSEQYAAISVYAHTKGNDKEAEVYDIAAFIAKKDPVLAHEFVMARAA